VFVERTAETGRMRHFDAFVCYTAADEQFVYHEMIANLENVHGLTLCVKERDTVGGGAKYEDMAKIIKTRWAESAPLRRCSHDQ